MPHIRGFPPIARPNATTLILGSMPSRESLRLQQYYAHARNGFWPILDELLDLRATTYRQKIDGVLERRIAIWDVLQACFRSSSLDSDIDDSTITTNDFNAFYSQHPEISRVFFNGAKAESVYRKHVLPNLNDDKARLPLRRLPSTSPAHAAMTIAEKLQAWKAILN